jgi:kynurenine formamidase
VRIESHLRDLFAQVTNWGRWGEHDERGTLNYIAADTVVRACSQVRSGRVVSAAYDLDTEPSPKNRYPSVLRLFDWKAGEMSLTDRIEMVAHSITITHIDALGHCIFDGTMYGGRQVQDVYSEAGLRFGSVLPLADGIVTTGVLLDVAAARGVEYLVPEDVVTTQDLLAAEKLAGHRVGKGDAVLVRVGLAAREAVEGPETGDVRAGLSTDCLTWIHEREVSLFGGDCFDKLPAEAGAPSHPMHAIGIAAMGLIMLDNLAVEPLRDACRDENRSTFALVVAPLRIPGGTGSPVNPICIF